MTPHSSSVRLAGLSRIVSGMPSLPMSWKSAAWPSSSSSGCERSQLAADRERELLHPSRVARRVRVARVDRRRQRLHGRGRALLQQSVRLLERDVLRLDRLRRRAELVRRALRVLEVGLLRLAHQKERQREDDDRPGADRPVRLVDDRGDEAVDEVVRHEPAKRSRQTRKGLSRPFQRRRRRRAGRC